MSVEYRSDVLDKPKHHRMFGRQSGSHSCFQKSVSAPPNEGQYSSSSSSMDATCDSSKGYDELQNDG